MGSLNKLMLDHAVDSIKVGDGTNFLSVAVDGSIAVTDNGTTLSIDDGAGSITVDFTRLADTTDSVAVGDGAGNLLDVLNEDAAAAGGEAGFMPLGIRQDASGSPVTATGDYHPLVFNDLGELKVASDITSSVADDAADSGNPIKIGGRGLDQSAVWSALSLANDRFDLVGDLYRRVIINDAPNIGLQASQVSVDTTTGGTNLSASPQVGRMRVYLRNTGAQDVYLGASGVTTATGFLLAKHEGYAFELGEAVDLYAITGAASTTIQVLEMG